MLQTKKWNTSTILNDDEAFRLARTINKRFREATRTLFFSLFLIVAVRFSFNVVFAGV